MTKKKTANDNGIMLPDTNNNPMAYKEELRRYIASAWYVCWQSSSTQEVLKPMVGAIALSIRW